jgi:hypothetical protein
MRRGSVSQNIPRNPFHLLPLTKEISFLSWKSWVTKGRTLYFPLREVLKSLRREEIDGAMPFSFERIFSCAARTSPLMKT